jgi:tetratricopeptide (TPR) repeat protein
MIYNADLRWNAMIKIFASIVIFLIATHIAYGQTDKEKALEKGQSAIKLMDAGQMDESIELLNEAQKLDPENFNFPYELAFAYYLKKDYKSAIAILEEHTDHKDVTDQLFQLLGNSYDISGKTEKAFKAYDNGLKKFPNSGKLYLEKGNVHWDKKEYDKALPFYETGIEKDPAFPSNYYRATLIYCNSTDKIWGMIYGEIFMNLERNSKRTAEISKLLYDTYKNEIKITSDTSVSVSFSKQMTITVNSLKQGKFAIPFPMIYEPTLLLSINANEPIDLNSLDKIRERFVINYFKMGRDKTHPNVLFDYQDKVLKAGHLEAYNHWILMKGDGEGFTAWESTNLEKWQSFVTWFSDNGLIVSESNKFYRAQYQ